jgi:pectinesterase
MIALVAALCLLASSRASPAGKTLTVAMDGSGDFKTVQAAVDAVPEYNQERVVIRITPGRYKGKIKVPRNKPFVTFQGEDAKTTVLTNDWNARHIGPDGKEVGTGGSYSVQVDASDFVAEHVTFENTAGDTGQALALSATRDRQVYRYCRMLGWQDTLYANGGRQYYDRCYIEGRVDFLFGNAQAVFDRCHIHSKNGGYVTAASTDQSQRWGYVFLECKLTGDDVPWKDPAGTQPAKKSAKAYLGRPWRPYASVTFVRCEIGDHIRPEGWMKWRKDDETDTTARFAEYKCTGPGADRALRVPWATELSDEWGAKLTVENLLGGHDNWEPREKRRQAAGNNWWIGP